MASETAKQPLEQRLRAWLLARPLRQIEAETGIAKSTLHRWLHGECMPRGLGRIAVLSLLDRWEAEQGPSSGASIASGCP